MAEKRPLRPFANDGYGAAKLARSDKRACFGIMPDPGGRDPRRTCNLPVCAVLTAPLVQCWLSATVPVDGVFQLGARPLVEFCLLNPAAIQLIG